MIRTILAVAVFGLTILPAQAQTPFGGKGQPVPTTPPPKMQAPPPAQAQTATGQSPSPAARVPMSADMKQQAQFQAEGIFPDMTRPGAGGQMQDAWNNSDPRTGVHVQRLCENCVYKVRTREFMTTTLILPDDAVITSVDPGDDVGFTIKIKAVNKVTVRPAGWGMDTNANVYTRSGAVYPFYIRSETVNSMNVPDLVVRIIGKEMPAEIAAPKPKAAERQPSKDEAPDSKDNIAKGKADKPVPARKDFIRHVPVDPAKFHGWADYKLWGDDELKPETVWRDDFFTYIRYGAKWDGMELATGYVTIDGIDELVNTHVEGSVFVVESISPLITLKDGKRFLCLQYTGETP